MTKFVPNRPTLSRPDRKTVLEASKAVEALAKWIPCDCGCPNKRTVADSESANFLRIAAFIRVELLLDEENQT